MVTSPLVDFLWSNVSHHLEHHLYPTVPFNRLPAVRRALQEDYEREGSIVDTGYVATALRLALKAPSKTLVDPSAPAYRFKVQWFNDILLNDASRHHLWSLYYAGEAYEELHSDGMLAHKLPEPERRLWQRQMRDETRHATLFRALLSADGLEPQPLPPGEDVAWYLLTHLLPDVVAEVKQPGEFSPDSLVRYMAFLHALELRSIFDLCALRKAAGQLGMTPVVDTVTDILRDERFHAAYCRKAVRKYSPNPRAAFRHIRQAERKYYCQAMNHVLDRLSRMSTHSDGLGKRLRWAALRVLARCGLAFPPLPLYDKLPPDII